MDVSCSLPAGGVDNLAVWLQEQRRVFDIHTYGSELLSKLEALGGVDSPVLFHHAVAGHQPYDICRYFLASLQLVCRPLRLAIFLHIVIASRKQSNLQLF